MLIQLGVLIGSYACLKIIEQFQDKRQKKNRKLKSNQEPKKSYIALLSSDKKESKNEHYTKASLLTIGVIIFGHLFYPPLKFVGTALYAYISLPLVASGVKTLLEKKKIGNEALISVATIVGGVSGYFFALSIACFFYYLGGLLLKKTRDNSVKKIQNLFKNEPRFVWLVKQNVEIEVPLEQIVNNDIIAAEAGKVVPIDGIIVSGSAMIDQSVLTGEFQPAEKQVGDKVFASTFINTGRIHIKVQQTGQNTAISQIEEVLNRSIEFKPEIQTKGEEWANKSAFAFLVAGGLALPILGTSAAVIILRSSFGYSLGILASLEMLKHLREARTRGIFVKDGKALEGLHEIDTVIFDKTGTLTENRPVVGRIFTSCEYDEQEILTYAVIAENTHTHPIAKAILDKAQELNHSTIVPKNAKYHIGYGVEVKYDDKLIQVGSLRFMKMKNVTISKHFHQTANTLQHEGNSLVMVAVNGKAVGILEINESIRSEIKDVISGLYQRGIKQISIISGDHQGATGKIAKELGIDNFYYDVLPKDKSAIVKKLQDKGKKVLFIGDGVNDSLAMVRSDISISLNDASTVAIDVAQIILLDGNFKQLNNLFDISKKMRSGFRQSLFLTMTPSGIVISGVLLGNIGISGAVILENMFFLTGLAKVALPSKLDSLPKN